VKIIVVDDREENLENARKQLGALGHEVITLQKSEDHLLWDISAATREGSADLMILDLMMPEEELGIHKEFQTNLEHPYGLFFAIKGAQEGWARTIIVLSAGDRHQGAMPYAYSEIRTGAKGENKKYLRVNECEMHLLSTYKDPKDYVEVLTYIQ